MSTSQAGAPRSEEDLLAEFGPLMWEAVQAFAHDVGYLEEIARAAASVDRKRAEAAARRSTGGR